MGSRVRVPFGKYKGDALETVPSSYLLWLIEQAPRSLSPIFRAVVVMELVGRIAPGYEAPEKSRATFDPDGAFTSEPRPTPPPRFTNSNNPPPTVDRPHDPAVVPMMREIVEAGYKSMAKKYHPDLGGTVEKISRVNLAVELLRKALPKGR